MCLPHGQLHTPVHTTRCAFPNVAFRVAQDGRVWPDAVDNPLNGTPGGACAPVADPTGTRTRCNYAAEIENLDRLFALVLQEVEARGDAARTLVCIASDHGEMLGDHGDVDKSKPWEGSAHVPLICSGPGILKGQTVSSPVATMDMAGTFMVRGGICSHKNLSRSVLTWH